jgi:hypothetical protein
MVNRFAKFTLFFVFLTIANLVYAVYDYESFQAYIKDQKINSIESLIEDFSNSKNPEKKCS